MYKKYESIKLNFGKYKGKPIKYIPNDYLKWCLDKNILKGKAMLYAKQKLNYPKDKWKIIVTDSVAQDGEYITEAYSKNEAIKIVQKCYNIQNTQSYCGTFYYVVKL